MFEKVAQVFETNHRVQDQSNADYSLRKYGKQ